MTQVELPVVDRGLGRTRYPDSIDKLVHHLACLAPEQEVTYNGKALIDAPPTRVAVGSSMFKRFVCADGCTSCCLPFTIDYTPEEFAGLPEELQDRVPWEVREIVVSGRRRAVVSFDQSVLPRCPYLTAELPHGGGLGCSLWPKSPIECASAPQVTIRYQRPAWTYVTKRPFGYGWRFKPTPAQCAFFAEDDEVALRIILLKDAALLERYLHWAQYLGVDTVLPQVVALLRSFRTAPLPSFSQASSLQVYP